MLARADPVNLGALHSKFDQLALENELLESALTKAGLLSANHDQQRPLKGSLLFVSDLHAGIQQTGLLADTMAISVFIKDAESMNHLPYEVKTATGEKIAFEFPLHAETQSAMRVSQLLDAVLATLDRELRVLGDTANGDVMQALAMALAVRTAMLHAPFEVGRQLAVDLATTALAAAEHSRHDPGVVGNA